MIRAKITTQHPQWPLLRQTPSSSGIWGDVQFVINEEVDECDFWIVCDGLLKAESTRCAPCNTLLITWEPPTLRGYSQRFIRQFHHLLTCHRNLRHPCAEYSQQAHPWFVGKSYAELKETTAPSKSRLLSIITSDKKLTQGHAQRYEFAHKLKEKLGNDADLFGRGIRAFQDKWDVLAPYRYSIALENLSWPDWLTEKLPDCFLAGTFPVYWGCPNVGDYFHPDALEIIDVNDFDGSLRVIERILTDPGHYARHKEALDRAKSIYLDQLQLFPHLARLLSVHYQPHAPRQQMTLQSETELPSDWGTRVRSALSAVRRRLASYG